jgi:hypothetical protein
MRRRGLHSTRTAAAAAPETNARPLAGRLDSAAVVPIFGAMSASRELQRQFALLVPTFLLGWVMIQDRDDSQSKRGSAQAEDTEGT